MRSSGPWGSFIAVLALAGCQYDDSSDLLAVHRIEPGRASSGDRVVLTGEGFPDGRLATVTFLGDLYRPGTTPEKDVRIRVPATPAGRNAVAVAFDRNLERRFVGSGNGALHTTFHGAIRVAFQPTATGALAMSGTARDARFDVLPSDAPLPSAAVDTAKSLSFLGIAAEPSAHGLSVTRVDADGRAAAAGLDVGDVLVDLDGVSLLTAADIAVRGGKRTARVSIERDGRVLRGLVLDVDGLAPFGAADLVGPSALVLLACAVLAAPVTPFRVAFEWLFRMTERYRRQRALARTRSPSLRALAGALLSRSESLGTLGSAAFVAFAGLVAQFCWLAMGRAVFSRDVDLVALSLGVSGALVAARFVDGGLRGRGFSFLGASWAAARVLVCIVPALCAVSGAVLASGRFVIAEMVAEQGGVPWRWASTRNPGLFLLALILVASAIPQASDDSASVSAEDLDAPRGESLCPSRSLLRLAEWGYLWTACGLAVVLFFGGWRVPGISSMTEENSRALTDLGFLLFLTKVGVLVLVIGAVRLVAGRLTAEHVAPIVARWVLPTTAASLVLATGWTAALDGARSDAVANLVGYTSVALVAVIGGLAFAALTQAAGAPGFASASKRGGGGRGRGQVTSTVNPWL